MEHMTSDFTKHIGLAHKVIRSGEIIGLTPAHWNALAENPDLFGGILDVLLGYAEIKRFEHIIDCDVDPFIPRFLTVGEHQKGGLFRWDDLKVKLWVAEGQQNGKWVNGYQLRKELRNKTALNACVLDYLLAHPHLIPEEWKSKRVFFWGTIYRDSKDYAFVRSLCWDVGGWVSNDHVLGGGWSDDRPAALRAS